ncbi:DUF2264 domain-containing protein [Streptomyces sporangiiformans]|uniref:DUF2264 domain-containing protein n=1 Tax=Streptomyces sporangiiformans TaxID=2315329 RepID=A0A505DMY3_9ACTN|nr:DUF2264 domain-containing protein [Streptomyces sporangiiformans]TPQ22736.1 DUF2264 domain-containing protein [Streptomyces sporangiiformans]
MPEHPRPTAPEEDRTLSPHTGCTRAHWEATADRMLAAALRYATPGQALIDLPGPPSKSGVRSDGLEGFARTFLLAALRTAGASGKDPHGFLERYNSGIARGTRTPGRDDAESWPVIGHHGIHGQPMVESASVALALRLTTPWTWDTMPAADQDRLEQWLRGALRHTPAPNNWYLFPLTVAGFLESVGRGDAETRRGIERGLDLLDGWYQGQGWYSDGDGRSFDHYNGWALHLYPMLHAHLAGDRALLDHLGPRLREFLDGFTLLFDANGAPIHHGRSLAYRFAAGASVALGALTGMTPLAPGVTRRVLSGALRHFLDRGALTADGVLSLGWYGPHEATLQRYSGPGSPYWASKGFLALLLPPGDPVWTATEEKAPAEGPDRALALRAPGLLIQTTGRDGLARLHNHGSYKLDSREPERAPGNPLYARLAYSTRTGPTSAANTPDNHIALQARGTRSARVRINPLAAGPDWLASSHRPVFPEGGPVLPSARIESLTLARGRFELRVHRTVGVPAGTPIHHSGWAVAASPEAAPAEAEQRAEIRLDGPEVTSQLLGLYGWQTQRTVRAPQGTAYGPWALVPELTGTVEENPAGTVFAALASLTGEPGASRLAGQATAEVSGLTVTVRWADGARTVVDFGDGGPTVTTDRTAAGDPA